MQTYDVKTQPFVCITPLSNNYKITMYHHHNNNMQLYTDGCTETCPTLDHPWAHFNKTTVTF
jgi:hypothetical protein